MILIFIALNLFFYFYFIYVIIFFFLWPLSRATLLLQFLSLNFLFDHKVFTLISMNGRNNDYIILNIFYTINHDDEFNIFYYSLSWFWYTYTLVHVISLLLVSKVHIIIHLLFWHQIMVGYPFYFMSIVLSNLKCFYSLIE